MSVTVITCVYGRSGFGRFITRWAEAVRALNPAPDQVIIAADEMYLVPFLPDADVLKSRCRWRHPQAYYLHQAVALADTDWVWQVDIDDVAMPDALAGLDQVESDVWQMGFQRSDGELYVPPDLSNDEYLASETNPYVGASAFRVEAYRDVGGLRDVAYQDWCLWRSLAASGASFATSGRVHFRYVRHEHARGETELTIDTRERHLAEMYLAEQERCAA